MTCIVLKFGGTSVATPDLIKKAALRVKREVESGKAVVVVVSAMAGTTNALIGYVQDLCPAYDRAEYDAIVSSGEQVTAGLLALSLQRLGIPARSWQGWQIPIYTSSHHAQAKIEYIDPSLLRRSLKAGNVAIVSGFQGVNYKGRITTLGRGGSDTTAVALAAALKAERCDIFTDVEGIYTADPNYVAKAGKLDHIAYQDMLELATHGAKVLQKDSVELAMRHRVRLRVLSSLQDTPGTLITPLHEFPRKHISGIAHTLSDIKVTLLSLPSSFPLILLKSLFSSYQLSLDMIHEELLPCGTRANLSFLVPIVEKERAVKILQDAKNKFCFHDLLIHHDVAKVSVVGSRFQTEYSPAHQLFHTLQEKKIEVQSVASSDIKISVLVSAQEVQRVVSILHTLYHLDAGEK